jgi:glycosyltransferase involved in cell wall biosynthesis
MNVELEPLTTRTPTAGLPSANAGRTPRVLHIGKFYPPHMGGIETHLQALCGALKEQLDLGVIVSSDDRRTVRDVIDDVRLLRVGTLFTAFSTPVCPSMTSQIRAHAADLVHIHLPNPAAVLAYLSSGHHGRLVITYHSDTVRQKILGPLFEPFLQAALRRSSAIIATSPNYLETSPALQSHRDRCHVIPYGIDVTQFQQPDLAAVADVRRRHGDRLIISVGRLVYYKGFEHLIRAMVDVRGKLLLIGGGPLRTQLEQLAGQLGVADKVIFAGEIQNAQVAPCYHAADVFALPSVARSEAFGIVQIEAMAAGLPVVNTSLDSGVPFVSLHEKTGLTVRPGDAKALAGAINRLLDDPGLRKAFGSAGVQRAQREFSVQSMAARTLDMYHAVLGTQRPLGQ